MPSTTCRHGVTGYCHDNATPAERDAFSALYGHAFDYAVDRDRDTAEHYAAYYAGAYFRDAVRDEWLPGHSHEFRHWCTEHGR